MVGVVKCCGGLWYGANCGRVPELILTCCRGYYDRILLPGVHDFRNNVLVHFQETLSDLPCGGYRVSWTDLSQQGGCN